MEVFIEIMKKPLYHSKQSGFFRFIHLHVQMPVEEMAVVFYFYIDK